MTCYVLAYEFGPDFVERRRPFREEHLRLLHQLHERGVVLLAGAIGDPPEEGQIVFATDSTDPVEEFVRVDPYVAHGVVRRWRIRPWHMSVGGDLNPPRAL